MPRLTNSHTGVVVDVDDDLAERLRGAGWSDVTDEKKAPAKKAASSKKSE